MVFQMFYPSGRRLAMLLATTLCGLGSLQFSPPAISQDASTPYQATWPAGWDKSELPGPKPYSGRDLGGKRIRLTKMDDGTLGAIMELTYFPRPDAASVNLDDEFAIYLKTVKAGYEAQGYTVSEPKPVKSTLGGLKDIESDVITMAKGYELVQFNALAVGSESLYAFSYSGLRDKFEKYKTVFETCKKNLVLK